MKISDETKVGILAAFGIAILIIGYSFLRGNNLFQKKTFYYAVYSNVEGLATSDPVTFHGFVVGKIMGLKMLDDTSGRTIAKILMHEDIKIPVNSQFQVYSQDLLGEKGVQLIKGNSKEIAHPGDTLTGDVAATLTEGISRELLPVKDKAEKLFGSFDTTLTIVQAILKGGQIERSFTNIENAAGSFNKVAKTLDTLLSQQRETLAHAFQNIEHITANLDSNSGNITAILENFAQLSDTLSQANLKQTVQNLNDSLHQLQALLTKVNNGEGTVGMLVNDKQMYDNLEKATANLASLLADVEANPKRYVHFSLFGGGGKKPTTTTATPAKTTP